MLFKKKEFKRSLVLTKDVCDGLISYCKMNHPDEMVLLLKGKSKNGIMFAESLVIPPFSDTGPTFAGFPANQLPLDMDYIGMAHSHPAGSADPSLEDLNNFFGLVSVIIKAPYDEKDIFAWDRSGNSIPISTNS